MTVNAPAPDTAPLHHASPIRCTINGATAWVSHALTQRLNVKPARTASLMAILLNRASEKRVLKTSLRTRVVEIDLVGQAFVIKWHTPPPGSEALHRLYHHLRCSPAWREWHGAHRLAKRGIRVCEPLALVHAGASDALLLPRIHGVDLHTYLTQEIRRAPRRWVADAVGRQIGKMTKEGLVNRDHKARNIMIDAACAGGSATPVLIDPAGLRKRRNGPQIDRMLALLLETVPDNVTRREACRCLRAAMRADRTLGASLRELTERVNAAYRRKTGRGRFG
ncbi:MAG: hypothetical protein GC162_18740 [Planctomycetes bacterium]|nr:hypothetical protein [Planctomycetota bacterium]